MIVHKPIIDRRSFVLSNLRVALERVYSQIQAVHDGGQRNGGLLDFPSKRIEIMHPKKQGK